QQIDPRVAQRLEGAGSFARLVGRHHVEVLDLSNCLGHLGPPGRLETRRRARWWGAIASPPYATPRDAVKARGPAPGRATLRRVRVLLLSNSGRPYLAHAKAEMLDFLGSARRIGFVTAASLGDEGGYYETAHAALAPEVLVEHLRWDRDPFPVLSRVDAVFIGGGNTYALLRRLRQAGLLEPLRERARAGLPYAGSSAGSNVAGPN